MSRTVIIGARHPGAESSTDIAIVDGQLSGLDLAAARRDLTIRARHLWS